MLGENILRSQDFAHICAQFLPDPIQAAGKRTAGMRWRGVGLSFITRRENTEEIINSTHEEKLNTFMAVDNGEN